MPEDDTIKTTERVEMVLSHEDAIWLEGLMDAMSKRRSRGPEDRNYGEDESDD